jgi:hypothetical protein
VIGRRVSSSRDLDADELRAVIDEIQVLGGSSS